MQLLTALPSPAPLPSHAARILHADIKPDNLLVRLDADAAGGCCQRVHWLPHRSKLKAGMHP